MVPLHCYPSTNFFFPLDLMLIYDIFGCSFSLLYSISLKCIIYTHDAPVGGQQSYLQFFTMLNRAAMNILAGVLCKWAKVSSVYICRCRTVVMRRYVYIFTPARCCQWLSKVFGPTYSAWTVSLFNIHFETHRLVQLLFFNFCLSENKMEFPYCLNLYFPNYWC